jgi:hypothetical protein
MTLFHLLGRFNPAFAGAAPPLTSSRVAESDARWDLSPPNGASHPLAANDPHPAHARFSERLMDAAQHALEPSTASQQTQQALQEAALALAGVDYLTQLEFSAVHQGSGFKAVVQGRSLPALDPPTRAQIDARMGQRFAEAAANGNAPVDRRTAAQWLHHELFVLTY